jgi:hypothetical protein
MRRSSLSAWEERSSFRLRFADPDPLLRRGPRPSLSATTAPSGRPMRNIASQQTGDRHTSPSPTKSKPLSAAEAQLASEPLIRRRSCDRWSIWCDLTPEDWRVCSSRLHQSICVDCSMNRFGNVWDNAATESFFSSLKIEWNDRTVYRTRDAARATANADLTG